MSLYKRQHNEHMPSFLIPYTFVLHWISTLIIRLIRTKMT